MGFNMILILVIFIWTFACTKIMELFFNKRRTPLILFTLSCLLFPITTVCFIFLFPEQELINGIIQLISLFIITLNYKSLMLKRFVAVGFIFLLKNAIDNSLALFFVIFPDFLPVDYRITAIIYLLAHITLMILAILLLRHITKINKSTIDIPNIWVPALIISGSTMAFGFLLLAEIPHIKYIWITLLIYSSLFLTFYLSNNLSVIFEEKLKAVHYLNQCQLMQESTERMKSIRHDMKIHLAALKEYTVENKAATDYINRLLEDINESEMYSNTGNIAFDSIINYKLSNAKRDNINLDLRISVPPVISVEAVDIVIILGNLLDNAVKAAAETNEKNIRIDIAFDKGGLFIKIENSFNGRITKSNSGYGLKNIKQSLDKYNGYMKITHSENIFSAGVFLYC
ncbi:MAG: GHKL domain-containing protein [Lachnospiraceae bacterium]|nr:GHKL domain-containing protein [Lachnospiraceae bacterium]